MREWQDLVGQLRQAAKEVGVTLNRTPAEPADDPRRAARRGCCRTSACATPRAREYQGARGARFAILPGLGARASGAPTWVMVAELVETSRLWGRDAARIDPKWVEPLAEHLVKRTYSEPRWDRKRGAVVATERVTLYGLPIVAGRTVAYGRIDPELSRELFIRRALVEGEWETRHAFFADNRALRRGGRARWRSARGGATSSSPTRCCSTSSTRASRPTSSPARTSTAGGATRAGATRTC